MNLVDELKAALPGWAVTGNDIDAAASLGQVRVACTRYNYECRARLEVDGAEIRVVHARTLKIAVGWMRDGLKADIAKAELRIKTNRVALDALGGGE
jgi:hypothetical protein